MEELAKQHGFVFSRTGCACNGSPKIYRRNDPDGTFFELYVWNKRGAWKLLKRNCAFANGQADKLQNTLNEIKTCD